ncbi:hypothetical protein [Mycobacterium sp. GA-2829]|uniref:hypothetical protein n=1 Tax=Mycobacterium sp. GA-2829 TaxID=1772283 RepID=UPI00073FBAEE|nr:hypothetical protein [Mycobacterium sp. GA-2829]KUI36806.1 hypothetical protein AU194_23260 [Mycobacterium sp. GA-2829]
MSWLLVAFIPWLLMVATFGLERLESGLTRDAASTADVDAFLQHAEAERQQRRLDPVETLPTRSTTAGEPARVYIPHRANTQFQQTRQANRV